MRLRLCDQEYQGAWRCSLSSMGRDVLLLGEDNPRSSDPRHALYPYPPGCAGWRLAEKVAGWGSSAQLAMWRTNLCAGRWSTREARDRAREILAAGDDAPWRVVVLLGTKVADAFRHVDARVPEGTFLGHRLPGGPTLVLLPHPSGRCRAWNAPTSVERARELLSLAGAG